MPAASLLSGGYASVGSLYHPVRALTLYASTRYPQMRLRLRHAQRAACHPEAARAMLPRGRAGAALVRGP